LGENGNRIFQLGQIAANEQDYEPAIEAFQYLIDQKGPESIYYYEAKKQLLNAKRQRLVQSPTYTRQDLLDLEAEYDQFLTGDNRNRLIAPLIMEQAELEALYLQDLPKAIALLLEVVSLPGMEQDLQSRAKLQLGDYYLMQGEIWEATLLYSQVDKLYKDDALGHEARFRNAKLSYYNGDFQWAQAQFDILKASTSKLIANDALDLSVFIMDNLGLDTSTLAMAAYADAEMLVFQNRHEDALRKLDSLVTAFPFHSLEDDVLYLKSTIYIKDREWKRAETVLKRIITEFPDEIRADNALFQLGNLYEGPLADPQQAMSMYERIFTDYSGSTFAIDARKRFRALRGDKLQ
jgi:tetratricopeptide (TPR) repeat protein